MTEGSVEPRVRAVLKEVLRVDESRIVSGAKFKEDLGADSLDLATLLMALEEEFKDSISDEDAQGMSTVGAAVETIEKRIALSSPAVR